MGLFEVWVFEVWVLRWGFWGGGVEVGVRKAKYISKNSSRFPFANSLIEVRHALRRNVRKAAEMTPDVHQRAGSFGLH